MKQTLTEEGLVRKRDRQTDKTNRDTYSKIGRKEKRRIQRGK